MLSGDMKNRTRSALQAGAREPGARRNRIEVPTVTVRATQVRPVPSESEPLDRRRMNLIFATILAGMLLAALDQTIVSTALPTIGGELGGPGHLSCVVCSYILADTLATAPARQSGGESRQNPIF